MYIVRGSGYLYNGLPRGIAALVAYKVLIFNSFLQLEKIVFY